MEKKRVVPIWMSVILVLLIAVSVVRAVLYIPQNAAQGNGWIYLVIKVLEALTFLFSLVYCFTGYKKKSARYFKLFCLTYALYATATIYGKVIYMTGSFVSVASLVTAVICCAMIWILTFVKDFGKNRSLALALIVFACEFVNVYLALDRDIGYLITLIGKVALAAVFLIMVRAKYLDKTARGTK